MHYDFSAIEAKWHKYWEENNTFHTDVELLFLDCFSFVSAFPYFP